MRIPFLLFTGFFLLRGSILSPVLPNVIVAQAQPLATIEETSEEHKAPLRPQKRPTEQTQKALAAVQARKAARLAQLPKYIPTVEPVVEEPQLLAVVDQEDILPHHRELANEVLRSLPAACLEQLENFYVRYDNPSRRGLAGKTTIILSGHVPDDEFKALLIHECGHITDLGYMQGSNKQEPSSFKDGAEVIYMDDPSVSFYSLSWIDSDTQRSTAQEDDFVSGYAAWDPFEDFAESFAYFVLQNDTFRERAQTNSVLAAKYRWMQHYVFNNFDMIATGEHEWTGDVPWDVTKLAYTWY